MDVCWSSQKYFLNSLSSIRRLAKNLNLVQYLDLSIFKSSSPALLLHGNRQISTKRPRYILLTVSSRAKNMTLKLPLKNNDVQESYNLRYLFSNHNTAFWLINFNKPTVQL